MTTQVWGQLYIGTTAPTGGPIMVGTLWTDTTGNVLKRCTSVAPITFVSVEGGSAAHDLFSATHGDVDEADTPGDGQILKYNLSAGLWRAEDEAGEAHRLGAPSELTIASGKVTVSGRYHLIDTEADASSDNLAGMAGGNDGDIVVLRPANDARTVVITHEDSESATATDRFNLPGDASITLDDIDDMVAFAYDGTIGRWIVLETFGKRHGDLGGVTSDQHHAQSHAHNGADGSGTVAHSDTTGQTANDHHNQSHDHSASGDGQTLSPATLNIPASATPAQTADGQAVWDSDDDVLTIGDGTSRKTLVNTDNTQTLTNKTLTSPTITTPTLNGSTANATGAELETLTDGSNADALHVHSDLAGQQRHVGVAIEDPTTADDIRIGYADVAITITKMVITIVGSGTPSVTVDIHHGTDRSAAGNALITSPTASTEAGNNAESTGHVITSFDDATIPADSHIWVEIDAVSGTVDIVEITLFYTVD